MSRWQNFFIIVLILVSAPVFAGDDTEAGPFRVEPPTLINLGFEWEISGDDNRNATVAVEYREQGRDQWHEGLPLLRIGDEKVWRTEFHLEYWTPRMFAGSIFDLKPGTTYECRLTLEDPDGVRGKAEQLVMVTTREEPQVYTGGRTLHVYPPGYDGPRQEPSFTGLKAAYYGEGHGDWSAVRERPARPGDVILVHAGLYKADYLDYLNEYDIPFHGTYEMTLDGTPEKPIVIKGAGDGEVIFDGNGAYRLFDVMAANYNHFEDLTIRNTDVAFFAGMKDALGCSGLVVKNCRFENVGIGVTTEFAGSKNFYIADNIMIGRDDHHRLIGWYGTHPYPPALVKSYYGVKVYGQGHVICHNYIAFFHDGICISTYGTPPEAHDQKAAAIDIYNNDLFGMVDNFIEADGGVHNIRVMRNRGINSYHQGYSVQPVLGGPAYFIRNIGFNMPRGGAIKVHANPSGIVFYHNTFITEFSGGIGSSNLHFINNLVLGQETPRRPVLRSVTYTRYSEIDYNGYRPNTDDGPHFVWYSPVDTLRNFEATAKDAQAFETLEAYQKATGRDTHSLLVDYDDLMNLVPIDPGNRFRMYELGAMDFSLREGSVAEDAGKRLPNINDRYTGSGPDLGALERGRPPPVYGPRR